jgi:hypothetical protein
VLADGFEHGIAERALGGRLAERLAPPRQPYLAQHRLAGAADDPRKPPVKLKSYA